MVYTILYSLIMLVMFILFIVDFFLIFKKVRSIHRYSLIATVVFGILQIIILIFGQNLNPFLLGVSIFSAIVAIFKLYISTYIGSYYGDKLNLKDFPLIKAIYSKQYDRINWTKYILSVGIASMAAILYSIVLFKLTTPGVSDMIQGLTNLNAAANNSISFITSLSVVTVAFAEEIAFRFSIQNYLAYKIKYFHDKYWIAILITALIWTLGHGNVLSPDWIKLAQIFPIGIMFGFLYKKQGIESTIIAHGIFNIVMMYLGQYLIVIN